MSQVPGMASLNISGWSNDIGIHVMNDSAQLADDVAAKHVFAPRYSLISIALITLALPGNMFVIAVYIRNMTTSTRVYMFALGVADLTTCVGGLALQIYPFDIASKSAMFLFFSTDFAMTFSVHLLVFVSIERFLAVYTPYQFNVSAKRAKIALSIIIVETFFCATLLLGARMWNKLLFKIIGINTLVLCVVVMVVCYTLIAAKLLRNANSSRKKVAAQSSAATNVAGSSTRATNITTTTTAKTVKAFKGVPLLFIVTVVFIACWLPIWLAYIGVAVPKALLSMFVINFVANPYIYSAVSPMFRKDARQFCGKTLTKFRTCLI